MAREAVVLTNSRQLTYVVDIAATFLEDDILFICCVSRLPQAGRVSQARGWMPVEMLREDRRSIDARMLPLTGCLHSTGAKPARLQLPFRRRLNRKSKRLHRYWSNPLQSPDTLFLTTIERTRVLPLTLCRLRCPRPSAP